jgi:hypothetical protein
MAAAVHGLGPATDLGRGNTVRIVNQVLRWRGLTAERINVGWRDEDRDPEYEAAPTELDGSDTNRHSKPKCRAWRRITTRRGRSCPAVDATTPAPTPEKEIHDEDILDSDFVGRESHACRPR